MAGFTLLELMTTLLVVAVVLSAGVPSYLGIVRNNRAATNANALVGALTTARGEAVRRGGRVGICRSSNGATCDPGGSWEDGWIVFVDGAPSDTLPPVVTQVLGVWSAAVGDASVVTAPDDFWWVRFLPRGDTRTTEAFPITFNMQIADCTGNVARDIEVNAVGRASVARVPCT